MVAAKDDKKAAKDDKTVSDIRRHTVTLLYGSREERRKRIQCDTSILY